MEIQILSSFRCGCHHTLAEYSSPHRHNHLLVVGIFFNQPTTHLSPLGSTHLQLFVRQLDCIVLYVGCSIVASRVKQLARVDIRKISIWGRISQQYRLVPWHLPISPHVHLLRVWVGGGGDLFTLLYHLYLSLCRNIFVAFPLAQTFSTSSRPFRKGRWIGEDRPLSASFSDHGEGFLRNPIPTKIQSFACHPTSVLDCFHIYFYFYCETTSVSQSGRT